MRRILSLRAEFRLGLPQRRRKPTTRQRLLGRTLAGRAVRLAGVAGLAGGGYALSRRKSGGVKVGNDAPPNVMPGPKPRTAKQLANSAKVARRRAAIGKPARYVQGGLKGRTTAERRSAANRVSKAAAQARQRLGANYRSHYRSTRFHR